MKPEKSKILEVIENYRQAYIAKDMPRILSLFSTSSPIMLTGVRSDAEFTSLEEWQKHIEQDWQQYEKVEIETKPLMIEITEELAWAVFHYEAQIWVNGSVAMYAHMRASFILKKERLQWRIVHFHFSLPK